MERGVPDFAQVQGAIRQRSRRTFPETPVTTDQDRKSWEPIFAGLERDALAPALVYALCHGDNEYAETLWRQRGPFEVKLELDRKGNQVLNGVPGSYMPRKDRILKSCGDVGELKRLFENIRDMNVHGLTGSEPGTAALITCDGLEPALKLCREIRFEGNLPTLSNEKVLNPELLLSLIEVGGGSMYGTAHDHLLCWASPEMVKAYPEGLQAFHPKHDVFLRGGVVKVSYPEWMARYEGEKTIGKPDGIPHSYNLTSETEAGNVTAQVLLHYMGAPLAQHGFFEDGKVLCSTSTGFLAGFEVIGVLDAGNLRASEAFLASYLPLDLMCRVADEASDWRYPLINGVHHADRGTALISLLGSDSELSASVSGLLSPAQWSFIASAQTMDAQLLLGLQKAVGIDNTGLAAQIRFKDFSMLYDQGYQFSSRTVLKTGDINHHSELHDDRGDVVFMELAKIHRVNESTVNLRDKLVETYRQLVSMGLWPVDVEREPTDLRKALTDCASQKYFAEKGDRKSLLYRAWLAKAGVEACIEQAKAPREIDLLLTIFGDEAMRPYREKLSLAARGQVFTRELGV